MQVSSLWEVDTAKYVPKQTDRYLGVSKDPEYLFYDPEKRTFGWETYQDQKEARTHDRAIYWTLKHARAPVYLTCMCPKDRQASLVLKYFLSFYGADACRSVVQSLLPKDHRIVAGTCTFARDPYLLIYSYIEQYA